MGPYKAPGLDGFHPVFYHKCWGVVGDSVVEEVLNFFKNKTMPEGLNDTLIVLFAKVGKPKFIKQFRPIALYNVLYKVTSKILVMRMQKVLGELIGPTQGSFLPGRLIQDNIALMQEIVHSLRKKRSGKKWMILKLDLEKAYDRLRWDFIEEMLRKARFPREWVKWINECVSSTRMQILWNLEVSSKFSPERGMRQGDPISPYLFVLCIERLSHLILESCGAGKMETYSFI